MSSCPWTCNVYFFGLALENFMISNGATASSLNRSLADVTNVSPDDRPIFLRHSMVQRFQRLANPAADYTKKPESLASKASLTYSGRDFFMKEDDAPAPSPAECAQGVRGCGDGGVSGVTL